MRDEGHYTGDTPMVTCRRCVQLGIWPDRAIVAVVGKTLYGDDCLSCGHVQEPGDRVQRGLGRKDEQS